MKITIQGSKNFHLSERIKEYINKKAAKLNYFKETINQIDFYLDAEKHIYKASAVLTFKKFGPSKFETSAEEMYTAIDKLIHKMDVKIQREKSRIQDHSNPSHAEVIEKIVPSTADSKNNIKHVALEQKPSTLDDAILQMKARKIDYYGFNLIGDDGKIAPAFLKKMDDEVVYLFKSEKGKYAEYLLRLDKDLVKENKRLRDIELKAMSLPDAKESILSGDFYYNIFIDNENKINFLLKEEAEKWQVIS